MKSIIIVIACVISCQVVSAQLKVTALCPALTVDALTGQINKLHSRSTPGEIEKTLPCVTDKIAADSMHCAGIFYKDKGLYFYPERNYFELRDNFKGTIKPALMGAHRSSLFRTLGNPKLKDATWDAFQTQYGTLVLYYNGSGKINKIQISDRSTESLKLCE